MTKAKEPLKTTGMLLDGAFATEAIDTSGEIADIEGMDISSLEEGDGVANYEHEGPTGNNGQEIVGKIIDVKKIFKEGDCSNDRHRFFWNKIKLPFLYGVVRLADGAGHPGAIALAALVRDAVANGEPITVRFSIEGSTIARDGNRLTRTIARKVALTVKPCNKSAVSGLLADPNAPAGFEKNPVQSEEKSDVAQIVASLARKSEDNPLSQKIGSWDATIDSDYLIKADSAGCTDAAPSTLTGGAALQREDISRRVAMVSGAKAALRDYDFYRKEAGKEDFVKFLKFRMPDADPEFVEHFADMVEDYRFKKAETDFPGDLKEKPFDPKPAKPTGSKPIFRDVDEKTRFIPVPARAASKAVRLIFPVSHPRLKTTTNSPLFQMVAGQDEHGRSRKYPTQMKETYFDPELGFLHTHHGSFKVNIPDEEEFNSILNSPAVQGPHDAAMKNWKVLNGLLEKGKLPPEIIMHASLFSGMSPSVAVHMQELAFSHLQDIMARGVDPTKPPDQGGPTERDAQEFYERTGTGGILPKYLHDYWAGPQGDATRIGSSAPGGEEGEEGEEEEAGLVGQQKGLLYQRQKWYSVENYHRLHDALVQYIHEHGTDGQRIARTLQGHKDAAGSHEAKVKRTNKKHALEAVRRGLGHIDEKGDIHLTSKGHEYVAANSAPGYFDATGAPDVSGFAPKTIRYALGMMGAGNVVVPDTHFIRHLFGLPMDAEIARAARETLGRDFKETKTYKEKPFAPNEFLKHVLWDKKRPDLLEAIDSYYVKHHPAFRYADRRFFGGAGNPQALFPGFWAHWLAIGPHEKAHGMNSRSFNGGTDHSAYWTIVNQVLAKHGLDMQKAEKTDESFVHATASAHNDMHKALGPGAAMTFYYSHLVPMLLRHAAKNNHWDDPTREYSQEKIEHDVIKGEATLISLKKILDTLELKKADPKPLPPKPLPAEPAIHGGRAVMPGRLKVESGWGQGEFDLLGEDATHYHIKDPMTPAQTIRKVRKEMGQVVAPYKTLDDDIRIDSKVHTVKGLNDNPEQHELVHGMAMGGGIDSPVDDSRLGINGITSGWKKNARGENVYVKFTGDHNMAHPEFPEAWAEASYYDSAKNFWGLGEHVPVSVAVTHPTTGTHFAVIKGIEGAEHLSWENKAGRTVFSPLHQTSLLNAQSEGLLDKMHIMNLVNGNGDRHSGNWMFDKSGKIMLIDHGLSVPPPPRNHGRLLFPSYIGSYEDAANNVGNTTGKWPSTRRPVHPKAVDWVLGLDPAKLDALWQKHNMPERARHLGIGRLESIQQKLREDPAQSRMEVFERPELEVLDDLRD